MKNQKIAIYLDVLKQLATDKEWDLMLRLLLEIATYVEDLEAENLGLRAATPKQPLVDDKTPTPTWFDPKVDLGYRK